MKAHDLAKLLLEGPNLEVFDHVYDGTFDPVKGIAVVSMKMADAPLGGGYEIDRSVDNNAIILE